MATLCIISFDIKSFILSRELIMKETLW